MSVERIPIVVVGAGQAGLALGYHLARLGQRFVILDAHARVGDVWRQRWDSLKLFTPARYDGLPGMPFPAAPTHFPTKDEMGDFLESYAARFALPVQTGIRVDEMVRVDGRFRLRARERTWEADQVVVAMSTWQRPRVPAFARELDPGIAQFHSIDYRRPAQLADGPVLIVGASNSGCEIAIDVARGRTTWLAGRDVGHLPFRIEGMAARLLLQRVVLGFVLHHVLTIRTPMGRRVRRTVLDRGMPVIRVKPRDLRARGVIRTPRVAGVQGGRPVLEDGRLLDPATVVWCTGFDPGIAWIRLPVFEGTRPRQVRGVVAEAPGLYFLGLPFIYSVSSAMVRGVGRDAEYVARRIAGH